MAVSTQDIVNFLKANPGMDDATIFKAMETYKISPAQMSKAVGIPEGQIISRIAAVVPYGQATLLGDTWVQPNYKVTGSGEDQQIGGIESIGVYKTKGGINDELPVGSDIQNYSPTGEFINTTKTQKTDSGFKEFLLGSALLFGGLGGAFDGLLSGTAGTAGTSGVVGADLAGLSGIPTGTGALTAAEAASLYGTGTAGLTAAELAQLDLATGGAGGTLGAETFANATLTGAAVPTLTNLTGGSGLLTGIDAGITAQSVADKLAADAAAQSALITGTTGLTVPATTITDGLTSTIGGLTPAQLLSLLQTGLSLSAITGLVNNSTTGTGTTATTATSTPTQGVPSNTQGYYNAIQQSYNQMMPNAPRDVMTPLQQWYSGEFSPSAGYSVSSMFKNELPPAQTAQPQQQQQQTALAAALAALQKPQGSTAPARTVPPTLATAVPSTPVATTPVTPVVPTTATPVVPTPPVVTVPTIGTTDGLMSGNAMTPQAQVAVLLNNPNLQDLPAAATSAITQAVNAPRSYEDVVSQGSVNTVDLSTLTPAMQRAYDVYQQSQIMGVPGPVAEAAYAAAGVDPRNPTGFFANLGLQADMPTQEALAKYAPAALGEFAKTGSGGLGFTVDPNSLPEDYTPPADLMTTSSYEANRIRTSFDDILNTYANTIKGITAYSPAMQQQLIDEQAAKLNAIYANKTRY
jgi:hypothetical protein